MDGNISDSSSGFSRTNLRQFDRWTGGIELGKTGDRRGFNGIYIYIYVCMYVCVLYA